ncbi:MAG: sigma-54 dependent transcriptional regulator [Chitinophagales bacterium]|nr:sigma-54 dependent transcriptional regulator [Chitinophagales bacterium]
MTPKDLQPIKQRFGIIGQSAKLNHALEVAIRVASTDLSVLITGESGVGKEAFSQIIHQLSARKHENFIAVNCGAIPEGTIDSELFGHEKGSFTGAHEKRKGYFETVNGGTIFLDEIGELPIGTQARLLRVLESGEYIKVGSSLVQKTDVRVLAATNVNLPRLVQKGKFREDLYYRLNTVPIIVPPLRERKEDIPVLFRKFCVDFSERYKTSPIQLTDDARQLLVSYDWPGNVRQLKNVAEQASVLSIQKLVDVNELAGFLPKGGMSTSLPVVVDSQSDNLMSDREILYKMMFDMRNDLNELKRFVWNATQGGAEHDAANLEYIKNNLPSAYRDTTVKNFSSEGSNITENPNIKIVSPIDNSAPTIHSTAVHQDYEEGIIEDSLSLADMEKKLIEKALQKHNGKRRDAALDLGISERTLYRKIKEYDINA